MQATGWERFEKYSDPTELIIVDPTEKGVASNILVLLCSQFVNGKYAPAQRELIVGCASTSSGPKKVLESFSKNLQSSIFFQNGDYTFDNLKDINAEGFNVEVPKVCHHVYVSVEVIIILQSVVEMGTEKVVKITWTPPANFDVSYRTLTSEYPMIDLPSQVKHVEQ